jgi:hypothetical protein
MRAKDVIPLYSDLGNDGDTQNRVNQKKKNADRPTDKNGRT